VVNIPARRNAGRRKVAGDEWLSQSFEEFRPRLRGVAYRMLGSLAETEDALQDAWVRVSQADVRDIENLEAWLMTVVARVCLNMLRSRRIRCEEPLSDRLPDFIISPAGQLQPEEEALLADSVGLALQVVLDTLTPAERLAFVLHDMFDLPFEDIAAILGRTPDAARQLASRGRRRVKDAEVPEPDPDVALQRAVVDAFFAAGRRGDFDALLAVLHPEVVLRTDLGGRHPGGPKLVRGATAVAKRALAGARPNAEVHQVLVNGAAGVLITVNGRPQTVMAFTVAFGKIVEIDGITDPERVASTAAAVLT
jgi:RNA polymerase sigma factor (sigma-70 family)